jgi:hypothetical protein
MRDWYQRTGRTYADPEKRRLYENTRYRDDDAFKLRRKARAALSRRRRRGLVAPTPCVLCGDREVVGHHNDYRKPLEGTWLCRACHDLSHGPLPVGATA